MLCCEEFDIYLSFWAYFMLDCIWLLYMLLDTVWFEALLYTLGPLQFSLYMMRHDGYGRARGEYIALRSFFSLFRKTGSYRGET